MIEETQSLATVHEKPNWVYCHERSVRDLSSGMIYACLCGLELMAIRDQLPDGGWMRWVEENWPLNYKSAVRRLQLAEQVSAQLAIFDEEMGAKAADGGEGQNRELVNFIGRCVQSSDLPSKWFGCLAGRRGDLQPQEMTLAQALIHQFSDATTLNQLFIDCGVIAQRKKPERRQKRVKSSRPPSSPPPRYVRLGRSLQKLDDSELENVILIYVIQAGRGAILQRVTAIAEGRA